MLREIIAFEVKYHLRQPLFHIAAAVFFALAILLVSTPAAEVFSQTPGPVYRNAPTAVMLNLTVFSLLGLLIVTAFVASSVLRDFELGTHPFFFTTRVRKAEYLLGRFTGSMAVSVALLVVAAAGMAAGHVVPWQDPDRLGPFNITPYVFGLAVLVIPNLVAWGAVLFALAAWSRRLLVAYLGVVFILIAQDVVEDFGEGLESQTLGGLLEPTGLVALRAVVRYWTVAEYNTGLPGLAGPVLSNRLVWLGIGLLFLLGAYARFSYAQATARRRTRPAHLDTRPEPATGDLVIAPPSPPVRRFGPADRARQLLRQTLLEIRLVFRSGPFLVLVLSGLVFVFTVAGNIGSSRSMPVQPVTQMMLQAVSAGMGLFLVVMVVFYGGEVVWRERGLRLAGVMDAVPAPGWVFLGAKLAALMALIVAVIGTGMAATVAFQLSRGFTRLEPGLYARGLLIEAYRYAPLAVLVVFVQVVSGNKFVGYLLTVALLVVRRAAPAVGIEHGLLRFGTMSPTRYSDLAGFGPYTEPYLWYGLYWGFGAVLLGILTAVFWPRGGELSAGARLRAARRRWARPVRVAATLSGVGFAAVGVYVFYNTNVLNDFVSRRAAAGRRAMYERLYGDSRDLPLPRLTAVTASVDIYPNRGTVEIRGTYRLENDGDAPIGMLPVSVGLRWEPHDYLPFGGRLTLNAFDPGPHRVRVADDDLGFYIYELEEPLAPGRAIEVTFDVTARNRGFKDHQIDQRIVGNGTFFANKTLFPLIGYLRHNELQGTAARRRHGLPPPPHAPPADDDAARRRNYLDADWATFDVTVSTSADQIAIGPGYLEREWTEGNRRYFHYRTDEPIINLAMFTSARFAVARDHWNGVTIEVYYHPDHAYNVERMIRTAQQSLDYFTTSFGPYPHHQLRIVEVPNYIGQTAFGLANTIAFSESWGFLGRVRKRDIDVVSLVIAHEIAHQWWNHQVIPADARGATFIAEALAEYSALMVMEHLVGPHQVRRFLRQELDRYLDARSDEQVAERPLLLVENQPYIHYHKGSLAMYALRDYVGEAAVNDALRRFLAAAAGGPPYPTAPDVLAYLREAIPPDRQHLATDLFETITLFDNRVTSATYRQQADGTYLVTLAVSAAKLRADERGVEHAVALDDWIDIGVFGKERGTRGRNETVLFLEKRRITEPTTVVEVTVVQRPDRAGIDPYTKLIDRNPADNVRRVLEAAVRD